MRNSFGRLCSCYTIPLLTDDICFFSRFVLRKDYHFWLYRNGESAISMYNSRNYTSYLFSTKTSGRHDTMSGVFLP